jgi:hypothetical protein
MKKSPDGLGLDQKSVRQVMQRKALLDLTAGIPCSITMDEFFSSESVRPESSIRLSKETEFQAHYRAIF